jgi:predicted transcriptional regulator
MKLKELLSKLLEKPDFEKEFCIPDTWEFPILRRKAGLTQKQLAEKIGTKQPSISRLEVGDKGATLDFIGKVAYALGYRCQLKFTKLKKYK